MRKVFQALTGIFTTIPGITIMISNVGVPPHQSAILFGGIIEATGCLCLLALWINKGKIRKTSIRKVTKLAVSSGIVFVLAITAYQQIYLEYAFKDSAIELDGTSNPKTALYPFWVTGKNLKEKLELYGGNKEQLLAVMGNGTQTLINDSCPISIRITSLTFMLVYQLIFTSLVFAFGILAIRTTNDKQLIPDT